MYKESQTPTQYTRPLISACSAMSMNLTTTISYNPNLSCQILSFSIKMLGILNPHPLMGSSLIRLRLRGYWTHASTSLYIQIWDWSPGQLEIESDCSKSFTCLEIWLSRRDTIFSNPFPCTLYLYVYSHNSTARWELLTISSNHGISTRMICSWMSEIWII